MSGTGFTIEGKLTVKLAWCSILLIALVTGNGQSTSPKDPQQARLLSLENAWNHAVQQKDMRSIDSLLDEDLVTIDSDGSIMNKSQYMAGLKMPTLQFEHVVNDAMQVQVYGRGAVVVGVYRETGVRNGKRFLHRERFVDTWINRNGAWLCVASQSTLILH